MHNPTTSLHRYPGVINHLSISQSPRLEAQHIVFYSSLYKSVMKGKDVNNYLLRTEYGEFYYIIYRNEENKTDEDLSDLPMLSQFYRNLTGSNFY